MPVVLVYDTETTGLKKSGLPDPRIMQLAGLLGNHKGRVFTSFSFLFTPSTDWVVQAGAVAAHGISVEDCRLYGCSPMYALYALERAAAACNYVVAFNEVFDRALIETESAISGGHGMETFRERPAVCMMQTLTDVCKIPHPPARARFMPNKWKWPSLSEAYRHMFGEDFQGAHDALADVRATYRLHLTALAAGIPMVFTRNKKSVTDGGGAINGGCADKVYGSSSTEA